MRALEKFLLKRSRAAAKTAGQQTNDDDSSRNNIPDLMRADSSSILSSSSCAGSEKSDCTASPLQRPSSRVTADIQSTLEQSMQLRRQQRHARQQWLEERLQKSPRELPLKNHDASSNSMSFLPPALTVKRKLVAVREQQVRNLLATERLLLQRVALSEQ